MLQTRFSVLSGNLAPMEDPEQDGAVVTTGRAVQQKRVKEGQAKVGTKKNRAAFTDITNLDRNALGGYQVPVVKEGTVLQSLRRQAEAGEAPQQTAELKPVLPPQPTAVAGVATPEDDANAWKDVAIPPLEVYNSHGHLYAATPGPPEDMRMDTASPREGDGDSGMGSPFLEDLEIDIDEGDVGDALACTQYAKDIFESLFASERKANRRAKDYVHAVQKEITAHMRGILVDWLIEVAQEYRVHNETLYLTVAYIDRFLSSRNCQRSKLQLLGVTCMLVAAKYEEIYAPQVDEFCTITDNTYSREEILATERTLLDALEWELTTPTPMSFLRRFVKAAVVDMQKDKRLEPLALYLTELTLTDYISVQWLPSEVAASAVLLARVTLGSAPWSEALRQTTQYSAEQLRHCVQQMHRLQLSAWQSHLPASRDKFSSGLYQGVSTLPALPRLPDLPL